LNEGNDETTECLNLFFSDQTVLAYVEPFKEKYHTFFDLLNNEQVNFNNQVLIYFQLSSQIH
jgi:hypothetical protein